MKLVFVFIIACVLLLLLGHDSIHYVVGGEHHNNTTMEEDMELEKELKLLNKPAIKTIVTAEGDIFDCVDINKQPALDNPLLKDHKVHLKPSSLPSGMFNDSDHDKSSIQIGLPDGGCPSGTVPLRRYTKSDLSRMKSSPLNKENIHRSPISNLTVDIPINQEWAALRTTRGQSFDGVTVFFVVYGLTEMSTVQYSINSMWTYNDHDGETKEYIMAGWVADPYFYGDSNSRLTTSWTKDHFASTGCRDTRCSGYVQVHPSIPLGIVLQPVSTVGGDQYGFHLLVFRDSVTKAWWLVFGLGELVGYWPGELFDKLADNANRIDIGGHVGYVQGAKRPRMGNGIYPSGDDHYACFITQIKSVDQNNNLVDIGWDQAYPSETSPDCYRIDRNQYYMFYYGGPGRC